MSEVVLCTRSFELNENNRLLSWRTLQRRFLHGKIARLTGSICGHFFATNGTP